MTESMAFSEAKAHLSELTERVGREHERFLVTRQGPPSFVLASPDDLDSLKETLDILKDAERYASLAITQRAVTLCPFPRGELPDAVYEVRITPEGLRHLDCLPAKIRDAVISALTGAVKGNPQGRGKKLVGELDGLHLARRGDNRIIYEVVEDTKTIVVHRVQHRADIYRNGDKSEGRTRKPYSLATVASLNVGRLWAA